LELCYYTLKIMVPHLDGLDRQRRANRIWNDNLAHGEQILALISTDNVAQGFVQEVTEAIKGICGTKGFLCNSSERHKKWKSIHPSAVAGSEIEQFFMHFSPIVQQWEEIVIFVRLDQDLRSSNLPSNSIRSSVPMKKSDLRTWKYSRAVSFLAKGI
jgi:hypothetical protein